MSMPSASVVVRSHNSRADLEQLLPALRRQSVAVELLVVDSGSSDGSLEVAVPFADRLLRLAAGTYSPGRSLNLGAHNAGGEVVFALSSHCRPAGDDWIERCLAHYGRADVAATNGASRWPDREWLQSPFYQDGTHARAHPDWGFSNHASSWRAAIWEQHPFDEELRAGEDRLWAIEVTQGGWVIAHDPSLCVTQEHRYKQGTASLFRRERLEAVAIGAKVALPPYPLSELVEEWWREVPSDRYPRTVHRLLNYRRTAGLLGRYLGHREARRIRR